jgi:hypothetical protein
MKGIKMKKLILALTLVVVLMLPTASVLADEYEGWDEIRPALLDGDGAEFVVDTEYNVDFSGTEFEKVMEAAYWVAYHMDYESDPYPGDVWTASDQQFAEIIPGVANSGTGDCEDFAILLCALMRFNIGVPSDRVWVQAGLLAVPDVEPPIMPPIVGHAYVVYKAERGGIYYIEPQAEEGFPYRGSFASVLHWFYKRPPQTGESAMLMFNDEWVKGGGFWLAGRR